MSNPRARLAGRLYCARFECVLDLIELDGFSLRDDYSGLPSLPIWLRAAGLWRKPAHRHATGAG
jgi:hypothetical protein